MTAAVFAYRAAVPAHVPLPRISVQFRILRDGEVTPGLKTLRVYRGWQSAGKLEMVFQAEDGEFTAVQSFGSATLLAQGEWLVCGADDLPPRRTRAAYLALAEAGTYTFNITSPVDKPEGLGYLAGEFPNGVTSRLDIPVSATIRVFHTNDQGQAGKVAEVVSASDGTWIVDNLDPTKQFDVICSLAGFNDLILSKVSPTPY